MHRKRIIPCLDVSDGRVVKGVNFVDLRDAGDPVELAARYDAEGADELIFLDITASHERRDIIVDLAARCAEQVFIPFTVGGGLRSADDVRADPRRRRRQGADQHRGRRGPGPRAPLRASGSARSASSWPSTRKRVPGSGEDGRPPRWEVYVHGGRTPTGLDAVEWAARAAELGAGEFLLTSMDRDGTHDGYDLELTRAVARAVDVPVIASGGVGHARAPLRRASSRARRTPCWRRASSTTARTRIAEAKEYLAARGVPVRPDRRGPARRRDPARRERPAASIWRGRTAADGPRLAGLLAAARLVCFPTDTVYGVGGLVTPAVRDAVIAAKGRAAGKPLQVIFPTRGAARGLAGARAPAARRGAPAPAGAVHPAAAVPAGLAFPPAGEVPRRTHGVWGVEETTVATLGVRVPAWPAAARALGELPFPLLASSANPSGGAGARGPWTRWTAACWPPATSSSTPGP